MTTEPTRAEVLRTIPARQPIGTSKVRSKNPPPGYRPGDLCVVFYSEHVGAPPMDAYYRLDRVATSRYNPGLASGGGWQITNVASYVELHLREWPKVVPGGAWVAVGISGAPTGGITHLRARDLWRDNDGADWTSWADMMTVLEPYFVRRTHA
jgi:hypothetical protein